MGPLNHDFCDDASLLINFDRWVVKIISGLDKTTLNRAHFVSD